MKLLDKSKHIITLTDENLDNVFVCYDKQQHSRFNSIIINYNWYSMIKVKINIMLIYSKTIYNHILFNADLSYYLLQIITV